MSYNTEMDRQYKRGLAEGWRKGIAEGKAQGSGQMSVELASQHFRIINTSKT